MYTEARNDYMNYISCRLVSNILSVANVLNLYYQVGFGDEKNLEDTTMLVELASHF